MMSIGRLLLRLVSLPRSCGGGRGGGAACACACRLAPSCALRAYSSPASGGGESHPLRIEHRLLPGAVALQRALVADRVRALEDPVLPGGEPREDLRLHRLGPAEAQVRLQ